jgi:hypothetical protein
MAFTVPDFNITCNLWSFTAPPPAAPRAAAVPCNLAFGRRVQPSASAGGGQAQLLLPAFTDVRDIFNGPGNQDIVEAPAGSGRFYVVDFVDDIGKGFANEHRVAVMAKTRLYGNWPVPIP